MAIATFTPQRSSALPKIIILVVILLAVGLLVYFGQGTLEKFVNLKGKSALAVEVLNGEAEVFLNDESLGKTPFESEDIKAAENKVTLKNDSTKYEVTINFVPNTQVVLNRDLGVSEEFSSGQNFWIEKSDSDSVLSIITDPSGASIYIDDTEVGKSPYSSNNLSEGEYDLRVEFPGHESQSARIKIQKDHKLNVALKLFPMPVPSNVSLLEGSSDLYDVYSDNSLVTSDTSGWVKGIIYWNKTRGINLAGAGVNKEPVFDYYLDYNGKLFDKEGNLVDDPAKSASLAEATKGAYLRKASDSAALSDAAKAALESLGGSIGANKIIILETGTGWLRVRDKPGLDGTEIARVNVGEEYLVLEEDETGWTKIKVSDTVEGWVSNDYVEPVEPAEAEE